MLLFWQILYFSKKNLYLPMYRSKYHEKILITWAYFIKCESNLKSTCLNTFIRHKSIQSTYKKSPYELIQLKSIQTWLLINKSIQTSHSKQHCIFIQFNQLICTQMKLSTRDIPWLAHDHLISKLSTQLYASHQIIQQITTT